MSLEDQDSLLRNLAMSRLKKQSEFKLHVMIYLLVNGFLVVIWWMTGGPFFWPVFPIFGWGIGLAAGGWDAYLRAAPSEQDVRREMGKLRDRGIAV